MKVRMLSWPFCLGLITAPSSLAAKIRGSLAQIELVLAATGDLKHLMISRRKASSILSGEFSDQESTTSERVARDSKKMSRLDKLEKSHAELKDMISSIIKKLEPPETTSEISIAADATRSGDEVIKENRGGDTRTSKFLEKLNAVKSFISQLQGNESHYGRNKSRRIYVSSEYNISVLWQLYNKNSPDSLKVNYKYFSRGSAALLLIYVAIV
nr:unnamed protein product [Callosobruchus chinensis]